MYVIMNFKLLHALYHLRKLNMLRSFVQMRNIALPELLNKVHFG
jgi:hypothetical protein